MLNPQVLSIAMFVVCGLLAGAILIQRKGESLGSAFGGSSASYHTKRGAEKIIFIATIVLAVLFVLIDIVFLTIK